MEVRSAEVLVVIDPVRRAVRAVGKDPRQVEAEAVDAVNLVPEAE